MHNNYSGSLKNPLWQRKRLEILNRDDFKCARCKSDAGFLHVHHTYYVKGREPWNYPNFSFKTLCENCHSNEHAVLETEVSEWEFLMDILLGENPKNVSEIYYTIDDARCSLEIPPDELCGIIKSQLYKIQESHRKELTA